MFLNVDDAAKKLGVSQQTIRRLAKKGKIDFVKVSSNYYVYDVDKFIKDNIVLSNKKPT